MAVPLKDSELVAFSTNFDTRITATPTVFGFTAADATAYSAVHDPFIAAYTAANTIGARSKALVAAKDSAKNALLLVARQMYGVVQANPNVTDANKVLLNVTVKRTTPTPSPIPATSPLILVESAIGRRVMIRLVDADHPTKKSRPPGVAGAAVFSHVGTEPPIDISDWKFEGNTGGRGTVTVEFPPSVPNGSSVMLTAFWFNGAKKSGVAASPVTVFLPGGVTVPVAA